MEKTFYAFIGALTVDSNLNNTTYQSLVTLLPYVCLGSENSLFLK